jgi:uncharacterized protein
MLNKFLLLFLFPFLLKGQSFPEKPTNYVTDVAEILDQQQESVLNSKLKSYEDSTTNQFFIYIAQELNDVDMTTLCQQIFDKWEIGKKGKDNGVLIGIFINDRQFRIHTGYGLEGALPDILTKKIQDEVMRPHFKQGDYFGGILDGVDQLIYYSRHEFVAEESPLVETPQSSGRMGVIIFLSIFALFAYAINGFFLWAARSSIKENEKTSYKTKKIARTLANIFFYLPFAGAFLIGIIAVIFGKKGTGGGGGSGSRSSGGWRSSSSSGSSFSGGGGGRSGGGGSSSSW